MIIEARINVKNVKGIGALQHFDFTTPSIGTDAILIVEGQQIHVGKQFLAVHSPVFAAMFYGDFAEKGKAEIELKDVKYEEFLALLQIIYPSGRGITIDTVRQILALADFYQIKLARGQAESYLFKSETLELHEKIELAVVVEYSSACNP
ncbi:hypothetical protein PFISCL1PPCAC_21240 [Pristionchus fissidentatus]|uniref:BTB domain-containing protein n=1 Tax=Pristionchus fissidentatus TaxID=1538716 RepID=A0AAV5WEM0_9BILA|nr:hypothetical protein PFISCL1PPCAC_21240 [Pristionchus fissidentatus]